MKFIQIKAAFESDKIILAEELICDIFFSFGFKGVVCDIPLEKPDEGFGTQTLSKPAQNSISGYIHLTGDAPQVVKKIERLLHGLNKFNVKTKVSTHIVDEREWEEEWKQYFNVTHVTPNIVIKPEWKDYTAKNGEIIIILDPGMAFGTGTHPSTCMCIKLIERFMKPQASFLDVGTGSGILMVAAAKLDARSMLGIDIDEIAVQIACSNLEINQIDPSSYSVACTTLEKTKPETYDLVCANIIAQVILTILPDIKSRMKKDGVVILSGIIKEKEADIVQALTKIGLDIICKEYIEEWVTLAAQKR
ncbi:MAG: 50S ribosomal protein L11 methyltransferase [Desulfobacteraceae bacterium]|nr:50S ribosomal protein L11 methyltransferase [Desulfobacteraceae bacterium]